MIRPRRVDPLGRVVSPAAYRTKLSQKIVSKKHEVWFKTVCKDQLNAEFIVGLQRLLTDRGYFNGRITVSMDPETKRALQKFQSERGLDTFVPCLQTARDLGLEPSELS